MFLVVPFALFVVALIDLLTFDNSTWEAAGQNKVLWLLIVIFVALVGPILYLTMTKPKLRAIQPS